MTKKIFYWLDTTLLHFCLASKIQKKLDCENFAIIDIPQKPRKFFEQQNFVNFKKTWFLHDHIDLDKSEVDLEYISKFEQKYDINLWKLALNDRLFFRFNKFYKFTRDEILSIMEQECRFFENILDETKPDFLIMKETFMHKDEIFYQMCIKRNIRPLVLNQPNIGYRCMISEKLRHFDSLVSLEDINEEPRSIEELQNILKSLNLSNQAKNMINKSGTSKHGKFSAMLDYAKSNSSESKTHYTYFGRNSLKVLCSEITHSFKRKSRKSFIDKNAEKDINFKEKFVYFPLAVEEERNILISAPFFTDQLEIIKNIAKSLPIDYKLFVKEAPGQFVRYWRPISEYKKIMEIPNVHLIHPSVNNVELIKNSLLVFTVSGSSGFEACFYNKSSIVFTDIGYSILPSVFKIGELEKLPDLIKTALNHKVDSSYLDRYMRFLEKNSFEFDYMGYLTEELDHFYFGGSSQNVSISEKKMEEFLEKHDSDFNRLTDEFLKKLS